MSNPAKLCQEEAVKLSSRHVAASNPAKVNLNSTTLIWTHKQHPEGLLHSLDM